MQATRVARRPATFRRGSPVWLDFFDAAGIPQSLPAVLEDVGPEGLTLRPPRHAEGALRLEPGTELTLWTGRDPRGLVAMVRLLSLQPGSPPTLFTTVPDPVRTMTVRRLYRVDTDLAVAGPAWPEGARLVNISGNGGLVALEHRHTAPVAPNLPALWSIVELHAALPPAGEPLSLRAKVVRLHTAPDLTRFGVQFLDVSRRQREQIVRYVLRRLYDARRMGGAAGTDGPAATDGAVGEGR